MLCIVKIRDDPENRERLAYQNYPDLFNVLYTQYKNNESWKDFSINEIEIIKQIERRIGG
jgi:hypothetical protein